MNITQGNIFWEEEMEIKYNYPYLTQDIDCDVLVIGGGISGAVSAYYQAKQGYSVVIIEKNLIGYSSTLENIGIAIKNNDDNFLNKMPKKDYSRFNNLKEQAIKELLAILSEINGKEKKVEYSVCDFLKYSDKITGRYSISKQFESETAQNSKLDLVEENEILNLQSAIRYENNAVVLNSYVFCQELVNMLSNSGKVKVFENTCADSINSEENKVEVQTTNRFKICAKKVILSTGIDVLKYLKDEEIEIYKTYNIVAKLPEYLQKDNLVAMDNVCNNKIIKVSGKNVMLSNEDIKIRGTEILDEKSFSNGKYKKLYNNLYKLTNFDGLNIKNCFFGKYLLTKDHLPVIDEIENMPNVYCNVGVGKNGIVHNIIGGVLLQNIYKDYYTKDMYLFRLNKS